MGLGCLVRRINGLDEGMSRPSDPSSDSETRIGLACLARRINGLDAGMSLTFGSSSDSPITMKLGGCFCRTTLCYFKLELTNEVDLIT